MNPRMRFLMVGLVLLSGSHCCLAGDTDPALDSFLAEWEAASRRCQSLDTALTVMRYDPVFNGDRPEVSKGRFYYESPGIGRLDIEGSETIIWQKDRTLLIDPTGHRCEVVKTKPLEPKPKGWGSFGWGLEKLLFQMLSSPRGVMPLVVEIDAASIQERYSLALERRSDAYLVEATPRQKDAGVLYDHVWVIVDANTCFTKGVQVRHKGSQSRTVYVFDQTTINDVPEDRDALIEPELSGFELAEYNLWDTTE